MTSSSGRSAPTAPFFASALSLSLISATKDLFEKPTVPAPVAIGGSRLPAIAYREAPKDVGVEETPGKAIDMAPVVLVLLLGRRAVVALADDDDARFFHRRSCRLLSSSRGDRNICILRVVVILGVGAGGGRVTKF